jgi:putative ATPase
MADTSRSTEVLTFSYLDRGRDLWLERLVSKTADHLADLRVKVFAPLGLSRHGVVLDLRAGSGLLLWEALRRVPEGGVLGIVWKGEQAAELKVRAEQLKEVERPVIVHRRGWQDLLDLVRVIGEASGADLRFEGVVGRNALNPFSFEQRVEILAGIRKLLAPTGMVSLAEIIPSQSTRPSSFLDLSSLGGELSSRLQEREEFIYNNPDDHRVNWKHQELLTAFKEADLEVKENNLEKVEIKRLISAADIEGWFAAAQAGRPPGYGSFLAAVFSRGELKRIKRLFEKQLSGRTVTWLRVNLYVAAGKARKDPQRPVDS